METVKLPLQQIEARFAAAQADRESRTVPMMFYTGSKVLQFSFSKGVHELQLSMDPRAVRLDALRSGRAPFTMGHASANDPGAVLGVISNPRIENGNAIADVRFSKRPEVEAIYQDVLDGILANVSVEASLHKLKETTKEGDAMRSFTATDWEPVAVALVAQGADPGARIAAASEHSQDCEIEFAARATSPTQKEAAMPETQTPGEQARTETTQPTQVALADEQLNSARSVGVTAEQGRITAILSVAKVCGLELSYAEQHIKLNTTIADFRTLAIDEQARRAARQETRGAHVDILNDEADKRRRNMTAALLDRFEPNKWSWSDSSDSFQFHRDGGQRLLDGGRSYAACTLLDIAKECLANQNIRWQNKSRTEIAQLAFQSTSDFPNILADVANKSLRAGYEMAPAEWRMISARRSASDFKTVKELTLDSSSRLEAVPESGEFKRGKLVEGKESWRLSTYGKIIAITRQAIINDDLGAFTRTPMLLGQEVAMLEADTVYGIITTNGNMADGHPLFGSDHANRQDTGAAISITELGIARGLMLVQKSTGLKPLNITPKFLVVPAALATLAEQYTSTAYQAATAATINPMAGKLVPIVESRLDVADTHAWYLFADPNTPNGTVLIYAYLEGQEGPYTETRNGFDVDGVEIKIRHDFGAAAVDWRGAVLDDGQ